MFQSFIKKKLHAHNINISRLAPVNEVSEFVSYFRKNLVSCDLIRIGGDNDGGYLVPRNIGEIKYCFSPGVDRTSKFEQELSHRFNIRSFLADASVEKPPFIDPNFEFVKKFIGTDTLGQFITLSDWINECIIDDMSPKILQMDIEGAEYDVLLYESVETLASFSFLVIEFHYWQKILEKDFLSILNVTFKKLLKNFAICHVHPNNCCGIYTTNGISVPRVLEVTFIRRDLVQAARSSDAIVLPHLLDQPNNPDLEDIIMPEIWWSDV